MPRIHRTSTLFIAALCVLWLSLAGRQAAQSMSVTPANPTISVGQTQQFTASGTSTPTAVSAGGEFTCVRLPDGTARCVGRNQFGQLGGGSWTDSSVGPVSGLTTATRVAAGDEFACALLANGTVKCWGLGESGQRGDGSFGTFAFAPVSVNGLTGAVALAAGYGHTCALLSNATMRCWGENIEGQLGNGTTANPGTAQPVAVSGITGAGAITTGAYHTCALLGNGTLRCWGRNSQGQLGNGTLTRSSTPVTVGGITGVAAVSGGGAHTCAVLGDGTVWCWGETSSGNSATGPPSRQPRRCRSLEWPAPSTSAPGGDTRARSLATARSVLGAGPVLATGERDRQQFERRRCASQESAAPWPSLPGGFTTAARSLGMARCGAGGTTTGANSGTAPRRAPPLRSR